MGGYKNRRSKWRAQRRSKHEKKNVYNGIYVDEVTAAHASDTLARKLMENGEQNLKLNFPDDYTEVYTETKNSSSKFIGLGFIAKESKWRAQRHSRHEKKIVCNGSYVDEETAAHASDTLARKLMENGEQNHRLNFPDDYTEVYNDEKKISSKFIGVSFNAKISKWKVQRWSKHENTIVCNGSYVDEETAAHASDTLARKLMDNGEQNHRLNFPDDEIEMYRENQFTSKFIGVTFDKNISKWRAQRRSRNGNKNIYNGCYGKEETAAHASDTLARKLMENGEQKLKLNFPDDDTKVYREKQNKRKRQKNLNLEHPQNN